MRFLDAKNSNSEDMPATSDVASILPIPIAFIWSIGTGGQPRTFGYIDDNGGGPGVGLRKVPSRSGKNDAFCESNPIFQLRAK
ncbi:MAG TPA: hypothetical protein VFK01_00755, partial [Bradyrhizobium sp.]|nr:hypothetical protein [Bradyrhizobium sp.]